MTSQSTPLLNLIRQRIRQHGPMDLGEYMALCLGHPQHGYYMTRDPFGTKGDFITAPEVSQMFGELIGAWMADLWIKLGSPAQVAIVECGPGRGTLMEDALRATRGVPGFHQAVKLFLMEMSSVLQKAQNEKLGRYGATWISDLSALPSAIPVILIGNEFLDALPVRQVIKEGGQWLEHVVAIDENDTLCLGKKEANFSVLENLPKIVANALEGDIIEISPVLNQFIKSVDNLLIKQNGAALFLDYGHAKTAAGDTLQAVRSHQFVDIFDTPGLADLTAHVDFENVKNLAEKDGLFVIGPIEQGDFLKNLGLFERAEALARTASEVQKNDIRNAVERLSSPAQMGRLFKVIGLCHDRTIQPAGF